MPRMPKLSPLLAAAQVGFIAHEHYKLLDAQDRLRLKDLVLKSKGLPANLTAREKDELKAIVGKLDAKSAVWKLAPVGKGLRRGRRR